jgi:hypothetical protein
VQVGNALKFTEHGSVTITVSLAPDRTSMLIKVRSLRSRAWCHVNPLLCTPSPGFSVYHRAMAASSMGL